MYDVECLTWNWFWLRKYLLHARRRLGNDYVKIVLYFCDLEDRKDHALPKASRQRSQDIFTFFGDCSQPAFAQASKQRFYLSILKKLLLARLLLGLRHYFVSLICLFSAWLQSVNRPIKMPRNQNLRLTGDQFSGGRFFFLFPCPPPPYFTLSLAPDRFSFASKMAPAIANSRFSGFFLR